MPRLLVVHHTSSPALRAMLEAVLAGARDPELAESGINVEVSPALSANATDVLAADGFVLGTPVNIGYMSGALKHFFDQVYYPCLGAKAGAPYGLYVHGDNNTAGAVRAVKSIVTGLGWAEAVNPVTAVGPVGKDVERQCYELGATVAANLALPGPPRKEPPMPKEQRRGRKIAMSKAELDAFLERERTCRVATSSTDGPHVTPLWYVWDGTAVWLTSLARSQRWTDIGRDPRIAVLVDVGEDYAELRGAELRGTAEVVGEVPRTGATDPRLDEPERLFARKYAAGDTMRHDGRHAWLRLVPDKISSWDFRKLPAE